MRRLIGAFGSGLVVAGIALLLYVAVQYRNQTASRPSATPSWSQSQNEQGKKLARQLSTKQTIRVPQGKRVAAVPAGKDPATQMIIPAINVDAPVVDTPPVNGVWQVADWKVGHLSTTPNPGAVGNAAYSAHNDIKGELFKRLGELKPGDAVILQTRRARYTYVVTGQSIVDPSNVAPLNPTATPTITLITCTPYWVDTQRLIVKASLKSRSTG